MAITRWNSDSNTVPFQNLTEADVIAMVNRALSGNSHHTTTYKYAFFKSILDNVFNVDIETKLLSYDNIAIRFTEIYWNLVLNYHLRQEIKTSHHEYTSVEKELFEFCKKYGFDYSEKQSIFPFESLRPDLQIEITKKIKTQMMRYVVSAFCGDTDDQFYHFNKKDKSEGIILNPDVYIALVKYKSVFEKQNYYEWIKYLEKANLEEDSYALANKLDASAERQNLNPYRKVLIEFNQTKCFYCGKHLHDDNDKASPVDHFIPWSFVKDDKLWNFVLACPRCNSSKSNILPEQDYFAALKERNAKLCNMNSSIVKQDFKTYSYSKLIEMHHSAIFNGFEYGWKAN
jgi:5-methylcytosine-specific restriction endonuclease McrA